MKKTILSVIMAVSSLCCISAEFSGYLLQTSFEDGKLPDGWRQEYVSGNQPWKIENSNLEYPIGAFDGNYRLALRNEQGVTLGFKTRLVLPVLDLSKEKITPILIFAHAQQQYLGDNDYLTVYYRTDTTKAWIKLKEYTEKIAHWQEDTLMLVSTKMSTTYQLAFEVSDNTGRGVVLDNVRIRPMPTCLEPTDISSISVGAYEATIQWTGSAEAVSFRVLTSTKPMTVVDPSASTVVSDFEVDDFMATITGLEYNTTYYVYLLSKCGNQESDWSQAYSFKTRNLINIPFTEDFNEGYRTDGTMLQPTAWTCGSSVKNENDILVKTPYINTNTPLYELKYYSLDTTTCVVFGGVYSYQHEAIPAGNYAYMASPEVDVDKVQDLEVLVWTTSFKSVSSDYAAGLIVGVMDDPLKVTTFVPVDTIYNHKQYQFIQFTIPLSNYTGTGKYIAFMSDFTQPNLVFIDKVTIRERHTVDVPQVNITGATNTSLTFGFEQKSATTYNLIISPERVILGEPHNVLIRRDNIAETSLTIDGINAGNQTLYIYEQAVCNGKSSDWSVAKSIRMPHKIQTLPYTIACEQTEQTYGISSMLVNNIYTNYDEVPSDILFDPTNYFSLPLLSTDYPRHQGAASLTVRKGEYIVLPMLDNLAQAQMSFYLIKQTATAASAQVEVGVVENPYSLNGYQSLQTFTNTSEECKRCYLTLDAYKGNGKYVVIKASTTCRIDDIHFDANTGCIEPTDFTATSADTEATLAWNGHDMAKWKVVVASKAVNGEIDNNSILKSEIVTTPSITIDNLNPHTTYYYKVATVCSSDTIWSDVMHFDTQCSAMEDIPYFETFDSYSLTTTISPLPNCWTVPTSIAQSNSSSKEDIRYPYLTSTLFNSSTASLYFDRPGMEAWFALPQFSTPLNQLQVSFWAYGTASNGVTLEVGVMTNPNNSSTFTTITTINVAPSAWNEYIVRFNNYSGDGKYIAFRKSSSPAIYIDDVVVTTLSNCGKVTGVDITDDSAHGATVSWMDNGAQSYRAVILKEYLTSAELMAHPEKIIEQQTTSTNSVVINSSKIAPNSIYYVCVQAVCAGNQEGEWSNPKSFRTACGTYTIEEFGTETFSDNDRLRCWIDGVKAGNMGHIEYRNYLHLNIALSGSDGSYAITPELEVDDIRKLQMSFDAHGANRNTRKLSIGIITDPSQLSTAQQIKTLDLESMNKISQGNNYGFDDASRYTIRFNNYLGDEDGNLGRRVIFLTQNGGEPTDIYIDNISFKLISDIKEPIEIKINNVSEDGATISWENLNASYEVIITNEKVADPSTITPLQQLNASTNSITISGLESLTKYYVYVRTVKDGKKSDWSNAKAFTTDCSNVLNIPYSTNFNSFEPSAGSINTLPPCWTGYFSGKSGLERVDAGVGTSLITDPTDELNVCLAIGAVCKKDRRSYVILPALDTDLKQLMITFHYMTQLQSPASYHTLLLGVADNVATYSDMLESVIWTDTIRVEGNTSKEPLWYRYNGTFENYKGTGRNIVIAEMMEANTSTGSASTVMQHTYIDNLIIEPISTCISPDKLQVTAISGTSISVNWLDTVGTKWEVLCVPAGSKIEGAVPSETSEAKYEFTNLQSSTEYDIYVRTKCDGGKTSSWQSITAETSCYIALEDAFWNFDEGTDLQPVIKGASYYVPSCWKSGLLSTGRVSIEYPQIISNYINVGHPSMHRAYSGTSALYLDAIVTNVNPYVILPQIDANMDELQLSFLTRCIYALTYTTDNTIDSIYDIDRASQEYSRQLQVGYMTNPNDMSTFTLLYTYEYPIITDNKIHDGDNKLWEHVSIPLQGTNGKYICIRIYNANGEFYIDDMIVEPVTACPFPTGIHYNSQTLSTTSADIEWISMASSWNIRLHNDDELVLQTTTSNPSYHFENLEPNTKYTFEVQAICGENSQSTWTSYEFTTLCNPVSKEEAEWGFEDNQVVVESFYVDRVYEYLEPACWEYGALTGTMLNTVNELPYISVNDGRYNYSRTGKSALRIPFCSYNAQGCYAIMPNLDFNLENRALHFFMRHGYTVEGGSFAYTNTDGWNHDLLVGHTIGDDISTFVCDTVVSIIKSKALTASMKETDREDRFWDEVTIPLAKFADDNNQNRIAFMFNVKGTPTAWACIYLDDIQITSADFCSAPIINVREYTANTATVTWDMVENVEYQLQLAKDKNFENIILDKQCKNISSVQVDNLEPATVYYVRMKSFCDEENESEWSVTDFTTACSVRFAEDFRGLDNGAPAGWNRYYLPSAEEAYKDKTGGSIFREHGDDLPRCWMSYKDGDDVMYNGHMITHTNVVPMAGDYFAWLVTPTIDLTNVNDPLLLTFNLALSRSNFAEPKYLQEYYDDEFRVIISDDNGVTWKEENSTIWSNTITTADYMLKDVPYVYGGQQYRIECSKFCGKRIKIAFYMSSPSTGSEMLIHLGNVVMNRYKTVSHDVEACQWQDVEERDMYVDAADLNVGMNKVERYNFTENTTDTLHVYNINVKPMAQTTLSDKRCEGQVYNQNGFDFVANESGIYKQKLAAAAACDSIVLLDLNVEKTVTAVVYDTICQNAFYQLSNRKVYSQGIYLDTLVSTRTGCDSILELHLSVMEAISAERDVYLCPGMSIDFGRFGRISEDGVYTDTIKSASLCDSIITLNVQTVPNVKDIRNAVICQGESYTDDIFTGYKKTGSYSIPVLKTSYGCDSTITLNLYVIDGQNSLDITVPEDELPYVVNGEEILPVTTVKGYYEKSITTSGCGNVVLKITVNEATALPSLTNGQYVTLQKVIYNNNVYIIRNGEWYDVLGESVSPQW